MGALDWTRRRKVSRSPTPIYPSASLSWIWGQCEQASPAPATTELFLLSLSWGNYIYIHIPLYRYIQIHIPFSHGTVSAITLLAPTVKCFMLYGRHWLRPWSSLLLLSCAYLFSSSLSSFQRLMAYMPMCTGNNVAGSVLIANSPMIRF